MCRILKTRQVLSHDGLRGDFLSKFGVSGPGGLKGRWSPNRITDEEILRHAIWGDFRSEND